LPDKKFVEDFIDVMTGLIYQCNSKIDRYSAPRSESY
jgi:hypothetical protein